MAARGALDFWSIWTSLSGLDVGGRGHELRPSYYTPKERTAKVIESDITDAMIATAMAKAEERICVGSDRCYALASDVESAAARCTSEGRCRVGAIISKGGREAHDAGGAR